MGPRTAIPEHGPEDGRLAANILHFARALRAAGLPAGPGRVVDAVNAVAVGGFERRSDFYHTLAACFLSRPEQRAVFDQCFHMFWRNPQILEKMLSLMLPELRTPAFERDKKAGEARAAEALTAGIEAPAPRREEPPDEIEVHCSTVPEIDLQTQQIRPDGKISFEAIGEIDAAGKTPAQVANILRGKVLELYQIEGNNPIDVRVVAFRSKRYFVFGQVARPGAQVYSGRDTVLSALALAGGPTILAWEQRIQIIRPSHDENVKAKIFEFNFDRMAAHGEGSKNVLLQEGDIIYVPPTIMAAVAMKIEEFIRPIARAFSGYYITTQPGGAAIAAGRGGTGF
ncbi:MAG: polysaccharide biosynthesis/export family protein [Proteobacteria bacterium]|nr:polysaccharide biosynthesis/export family protein [Pseudomonadota bacterium]